MDLKKCPDMTFFVDCDVIQADGGTRTTAITGSWVALKLAIDKMLRSGKLRQQPLLSRVAGLSIGLTGEDMLVDLNYEEDSNIDLDMNIVMAEGGVLAQGSADAVKAMKPGSVLIDLAAENGRQPLDTLEVSVLDRHDAVVGEELLGLALLLHGEDRVLPMIARVADIVELERTGPL